MLIGVYLGLVILGLKFFWGPNPAWMAFIMPCGNILETALAFSLFRLIVPRFDRKFTNVRDLAFFLLLCPWIPALSSAVITQLLLQYIGTVPPNRLISEVAVYSLGNATGILLVTPLILIWKDFRSFAWKSRQGLMIAGQLALVLVGLWFFYGDHGPTWFRLVAVAIIPLVAWGIWITGIRGATLVCFSVSISYFAFDVPGARPLSSLLEEKQRSAELRFVMEYKFQGVKDPQTPPRLAREIADQTGLLAIICITLLPLGLASDELRQKTERDRLAMAALRSSFWNWTTAGGSEIENPEISRLLSPWAQLFHPGRKTGSIKITPPGKGSPTFLSQWVIQETDEAGQPIRVTGILRNVSVEEERDAAMAQVRLAELEIQTLRSHLNPHLLFNCLTGLRGLITEDPVRARDFSGRLARFLRAVVDSQKQRTIPLAQELAICEDFAGLEELRGRPTTLQIRLNDRDMEVAIPPLTLVTLVENAAKHGTRKTGHPLEVKISALRLNPRSIQIRVHQAGCLQPPVDPQNHAGLDLLRRQLAMLFGADGRLTLTEEKPGMVTATLSLPA